MIAASTALGNYESICRCSLSVPRLGMVGLRAGRWMGTGRFLAQVFNAHIKPYSHLAIPLHRVTLPSLMLLMSVA